MDPYNIMLNQVLIHRSVSIHCHLMSKCFGVNKAQQMFPVFLCFVSS